MGHIDKNMSEELGIHYGGEIPEYIKKAGKTYMIITAGDCLGGELTKKITVEDVIHYYAHDARNISSGCRSLAGIVGDWRPIDNLAQECLSWFKRVNRPALVKEGAKYGMKLR